MMYVPSEAPSISVVESDLKWCAMVRDAADAAAVGPEMLALASRLRRPGPPKPPSDVLGEWAAFSGDREPGCEW
jgi:hypothetical protein